MTEGRGFSNAKSNREFGWRMRGPMRGKGPKEVLA
jgi:hypothetical protein